MTDAEQRGLINSIIFFRRQTHACLASWELLVGDGDPLLLSLEALDYESSAQKMGVIMVLLLGGLAQNAQQ